MTVGEIELLLIYIGREWEQNTYSFYNLHNTESCARFGMHPVLHLEGMCLTITIQLLPTTSKRWILEQEQDETQGET